MYVLGLQLEKFSIERVNKSGAIFDSTKLLMELKCSATQSLVLAQQS